MVVPYGLILGFNLFNPSLLELPFMILLASTFCVYFFTWLAKQQFAWCFKQFSQEFELEEIALEFTSKDEVVVVLRASNEILDFELSNMIGSFLVLLWHSQDQQLMFLHKKVHTLFPPKWHWLNRVIYSMSPTFYPY
jgi:hypothetical protein